MPHRPVFILTFVTALHRPVGPARFFYTRDEARAVVRAAFDPSLFALGDAPHYATISHPDGTRESMEFGRARLGRRERLLAFAAAFCASGGNHRGRFTLRAGFNYDDLTDTALERLRADMLHAYWSMKRSNRESREHFARATAGRQVVEAA